MGAQQCVASLTKPNFSNATRAPKNVPAWRSLKEDRILEQISNFSKSNERMLVAIPRSFARARQASDRAQSDQSLEHAFGLLEERESV